jgi:hypothetical protein
VPGAASLDDAVSLARASGSLAAPPATAGASTRAAGLGPGIRAIAVGDDVRPSLGGTTSDCEQCDADDRDPLISANSNGGADSHPR